jgi:hypothetical protein
MGNHRHQALVAGYDGGRDEGQPRVLHAALRKARRHDQDVVPAPAIGPEGLLVGLDHRLGIGKLLGRLLEHGLFRIHTGARPGFLKFQIADGESNQV